MQEGVSLRVGLGRECVLVCEMSAWRRGLSMPCALHYLRLPASSTWRSEKLPTAFRQTLSSIFFQGHHGKQSCRSCSCDDLTNRQHRHISGMSVLLGIPGFDRQLRIPKFFVCLLGMVCPHGVSTQCLCLQCQNHPLCVGLLLVLEALGFEGPW